MNLRYPENLSCVWISHSGPGSKSADIDVIPLRQIRTCDFAAGAAAAGNAVGVVFSSLAGFDDASSIGVGLGLASAAPGIREAGRRTLRIFLVC